MGKEKEKYSMVRKITNKILLIALFSLLTTTFSCQNVQVKDKKMNKIEWSATRCAPKNYPVEILHGYFAFREEKIYIPSRGSANNGWGNSGPTHIIGDVLKPIPERLVIQWFSFVEDKFYQGDFSLPLETLTKLFNSDLDTYLSTGKSKYNELNIGLAPGGLVVVWISDGGTQTEIGKYHANEVQLTMKELNPNGIQDREAYINLVLKEDVESNILKEIRENGIDYVKWKDYRKKYQWRPLIKFEGNGKLDYLGFHSYSAEREIVLAESYKKDNNYKNRAILKKMSINWHDENDNSFGAQLYFNKKEIFDAYNKLFNEKQAEHAELVFKIDKYNSHIQIFLKNEQDFIELKKMKVETYKISK